MRLQYLALQAFKPTPPEPVGQGARDAKERGRPAIKTSVAPSIHNNPFPAQTGPYLFKDQARGKLLASESPSSHDLQPLERRYLQPVVASWRTRSLQCRSCPCRTPPMSPTSSSLPYSPAAKTTLRSWRSTCCAPQAVIPIRRWRPCAPSRKPLQWRSMNGCSPRRWRMCGAQEKPSAARASSVRARQGCGPLAPPWLKQDSSSPTLLEKASGRRKVCTVRHGCAATVRRSRGSDVSTAARLTLAQRGY
jgi:hypothetical protein